jgi:hypothetical protein
LEAKLDDNRSLFSRLINALSQRAVDRRSAELNAEKARRDEEEKDMPMRAWDADGKEVPWPPSDKDKDKPPVKYLGKRRTSMFDK